MFESEKIESTEKANSNLENMSFLRVALGVPSLVATSSPRQDLTFDYLYDQYRRKGYDYGDNLLVQLHFHLPEGGYNYLAFLLSDQNDLYIQYARYATEDVFDLVERKGFTGQSLVKTAKDIFDFLQNHNTTYSRILPSGRLDIEKVNSTALREIVVNALVHNDYRRYGVPTFEEFTNRIEVSSYGGLPCDISPQDFFNGYSLPVNPELIRVFRDLGIAESLGTGIRRVLHFYPKDIFMFSPNFIRVSIPFASPDDLRKEEKREQGSLVDLIRKNPNLTIRELSLALGVSVSTVNREMAKLVSEGVLSRVGSRKTGYWDVSNDYGSMIAAEDPSAGYGSSH